jgi:hypothetical protein
MDNIENKEKGNGDRPAYPTNARMYSEAQGMSKRELFAMAAMQGILSGHMASEGREKSIADQSVRMADELLKALES